VFTTVTDESATRLLKLFDQITVFHARTSSPVARL
jgi:hypothetical protein